jgi:protein-S-isoprenylcysteine O-methyltransferase Ste14
MIMDREQFELIVKIWIAMAMALFPVLLIVTAPYGRHSRRDWGPMIPNRLGWIIMEIPSLVMFTVFFLIGPNRMNLPLLVFFLLYVIHYTNRSLVFPLRTHTSRKMMPLVIALMAIFFNLVNGFINGYYFGTISEGYSVDWMVDLRFIAGAIFFLAGMTINIRADNVLLALRKSSVNGYAIPTGGLFKYVSCPNFLGEILEWTGFAIMTWSPAALAFAVWTVVNLVPRALDHHKWYKTKFADYPEKRKAILPFVL